MMKQLLTWVRIGLLRLQSWWLILFNGLLRRKIQLLKSDLCQEEPPPARAPHKAKKPVNPFQRTPHP